VSFTDITLCVASQRVLIVVVVVYFVMTQSGNFWIHSSYMFSVLDSIEFLLFNYELSYVYIWTRKALFNVSNATEITEILMQTIKHLVNPFRMANSLSQNIPWH
jgi:hypothetical protein